MKPCRDCEEILGLDIDRCLTYYCCSKYIEWQVDAAWRVEHERHADPQERRSSPVRCNDDREV